MVLNKTLTYSIPKEVPTTFDILIRPEEIKTKMNHGDVGLIIFYGETWGNPPSLNSRITPVMRAGDKLIENSTDPEEFFPYMLIDEMEDDGFEFAVVLHDWIDYRHLEYCGQQIYDLVVSELEKIGRIEAK